MTRLHIVSRTARGIVLIDNILDLDDQLGQVRVNLGRLRIGQCVIQQQPHAFQHDDKILNLDRRLLGCFGARR